MFLKGNKGVASKGPGVMGQIPTNDLLLSQEWVMSPPGRAVVRGEYDKAVPAHCKCESRQSQVSDSKG